VIPSVVERI